MSGQHIPKEQLTAYERWEVAAFDEAERMTQKMRMAEASGKAGKGPLDAVPSDKAPETIGPEELAKLRQQAMDAGRQAGLEEGRKNGFATGYAEGAQATLDETRRIASTANAFAAALRDSESALADHVLQLSLDIAQRVLGTTLKLKPELILPVVREAMAALVSQHGHPTLVLHPDDAAMIRPQIEDQIAHTAWRVIEDLTVTRGGCRVENGGAEVSALLQDRWRRVVESLGQKTEWILPE